jgi:recombination protein RecA
MSSEERRKKLLKLLGAERVLKISEMPTTWDVVPSGIMTLDMATGIGGLPRGNVSMFYGPEAGGKTSLAYAIVASTVKAGGTAMLLDTERKTAPNWIRKLMGECYGIDPDDAIVVQPEDGVDALNIVRKSIPVADVIVIDSLYNLVTPGEIDADSGDTQWAALAKLLGNNKAIWSNILPPSRCAMVWINQIRASMDPYVTETIPGGWVPKFTPIIAGRIRRKEQIKKGNRVIGQRGEIRIVKNQCAAPFKRAQFAIYFETGLDLMTDVWETGLELGVIERAGSYFSWRPESETGFKSIQGIKAARDHITEQGLLPRIEEDVRAAFAQHASQES